jgi:methylated-DNA-[protein]-cysteine S-methyltransferase
MLTMTTTTKEGERGLVHEGPLGPLSIVASERAVTGIYFGVSDARATAPRLRAAPRGSLLAQAVRELDAYFAGRLRRFSVPLAPVGTPFQRAVWSELERIPFGETRSYAEIARALGRPSAVRAVGAANGRNPISIVVPCHRIVGSDASLTGYAGGLPKKAWLLRHEGVALRSGAP